MIIPIKCFTCGEVLADKYRYYCEEVRKQKLKDNQNEKVLYFDKNYNKKSVEGIILDEMRLTKYCCRRHMLTHVDID